MKSEHVQGGGYCPLYSEFKFQHVWGGGPCALMSTLNKSQYGQVGQGAVQRGRGQGLGPVQALTSLLRGQTDRHTRLKTFNFTVADFLWP